MSTELNSKWIVYKVVSLNIPLSSGKIGLEQVVSFNEKDGFETAKTWLSTHKEKNTAYTILEVFE